MHSEYLGCDNPELMGAGGDASRGPGFDYIAEFAVAMPILTVAAVEGEGATSSVEHPVALFAVQATAIQQYTLDPALCMPPALDAAVTTTPLEAVRR